MKSIKLSFDATHEQESYWPGDVLAGFCDVEIAAGTKTEPTTIVLTLQGQSNVYWMDERYRYNTAEAYESKESFVQLEQELILTGDSLAPGLHCLPFSFELPSTGLKSSFDGQHGSISYWIEARSAGSSKPKDKLQFKVVELIETSPESQAVGGTNSKTSRSCPFIKSAPITISAECDRSSFCPGDLATVTADFSNLSSGKVKPYAKLVQTSYYLGSSTVTERWARTRATKSFTLRAVKGDDSTLDSVLPPDGTWKWSGVQFQVPKVPPSSECSNIQVRYYIEVGLQNLKVCLPVFIGSVPPPPPPSYYEAAFPKLHSSNCKCTRRRERSNSDKKRLFIKSKNSSKRSRFLAPCECNFSSVICKYACNCECNSFDNINRI